MTTPQRWSLISTFPCRKPAANVKWQVLQEAPAMNDQNGDNSIRMFRRDLLRLGSAGLVGGSLLTRVQSKLGQPFAQPSPTSEATYVPRPRAPQYRFRVGTMAINPDGRGIVPGIVVNGQYPGPEIRVREGSTLRVEVENTISNEATSVHWHGLLLPACMDGVPAVSGFPIAPNRVFVYEYPLL